MSNLKAYYKWVEDRGDATHRVNYDLTPSDIVMDAGGYIGDFAESIHELYGCTVHVFEPVKEFCLVIENRFQSNPKITANEYGLGSSTKKQSTSGKADSTQLVESTGTGEEVYIKDIKEVLDDLGSPTVALFKINIEGGEYDLLDRIIETGLIKDIKNLQIQFHDFHPNAVQRRDDIVNHLKKTHVCKYNYPFIWEGWQIK